jgi:DNA-binding SARP family transcriptional activator
MGLIETHYTANAIHKRDQPRSQLGERDQMPLTIRLLGSPEILAGERPLSFRTRKVLALLIYLVVEGGMHSRESLMALLWPDTEPVKAAVTLRGTLSRLRKSLRPAGQFLITEAGRVGFDFGGAVELDLARLAAIPQPEIPPQDLEAILELDRGEFLAGFSLPDAPDFDNWAAIQREACQRQVETVYDRLSQHQLTAGEGTSAVETAARWVARAPFSETAYRRLMAGQALAGDRAAALKTYEQCRAMLQEEFGLEPARETAVLAEHIQGNRVPEEPVGRLTKHQAGPKFPSSPGGRGLTLPFEGRAEEHSQLVGAFRQTQENRAQVVVLIGSAGVGKTRLANVFHEWVTLDMPDAEFWAGRAFEMGGRLSYQPAIEAFRARLEEENAPEDLLDDVWLSELSQLMPELRARYPDLPPPMTGEADFVRSRLYAAVATLGEALTAQGPAVFVLDDMQWADAGTLDMVHYLVQRWAGKGAPILTLLMLRQESFAAEAGLRQWLTQLGRDVPLTRLLLNTLSGTAVRRLVAYLASPAADKATTDAFGDWLWAETRGLPFFIEAMLGMLADQGILVPAEANGRPGYDFAAALTKVRSTGKVPIPPGVREVLLARLERLSEAESGLLLAAAVVGRECSYPLLCQVGGVAETEALPALEALLDAQLLVERGSDRRPYTLAHDYIREVAYGEARKARRRMLHRRTLIALEARRAPAAECAFHALASLLDEPAFRYSLAAGDEALANYALQESLAHYDRARDVRRTMAAEQVDPESLLRLYQNRGRALELSQQDEAARDNYQEMLVLAEARNDPSLKLVALTAQCIIHATNTSVFNPQRARELAQAARDLARTLNDRAAEARAVWCMMLVEHFGGGENQKILTYGKEALAIAQKLGLRELTGYVQTNLAWAYFNSEQLKEAHKANDEARAIWQALGNLPMVADSYTIRLYIYLHTGEYDALLALEPEALHLSRSINNMLHESMALINISDAHCFQGRFGQALAILEKALSIAEESSLPNTPFGFYPNLTLIYLFAGALEQAEQWADRLYAYLEEFPPVFRTSWLVAIARAKIARGKLREGEAILGRDMSVLDRDNLSMMDMVPVFVADGHLQLALGNPERTLERMEAVIQRLNSVGSRKYLAEAYWLRGRAWLVLEEIGQAREALLEAKAAAEGNSERGVLWRTLATLIDVERLSGGQSENERLRCQQLTSQLLEVVSYIADHAGSEELRAAFLGQPGVRDHLPELVS